MEIKDQKGGCTRIVYFSTMKNVKRSSELLKTFCVCRNKLNAHEVHQVMVLEFPIYYNPLISD